MKSLISIIKAQQQEIELLRLQVSLNETKLILNQEQPRFTRIKFYYKKGI